ncbi:unnamed protein product [Rotaria sordida]|uniref:Uncharacterized protein n=1 Tax=Rotaria sordida TaxID=392033 RepID=A0A816BWA9_9BILA|nr:unnamed protein product [Rotaria sordida]CAF1614858.1 unnamed protein product [Rotaria sordida]
MSKLRTLAVTDSYQHLELIDQIPSITNLTIPNYISNSYHMEMSFVLLEILKEASNLSSIRIAPHIFKALFDDNGLQKYLNKMIRKGNNLFAK